MRIVTLFAQYGTNKYPFALQNLDQFFSKCLLGVDRHVVVIDNGLPEDYVEVIDNGTTVIGGSNSNWEFSAWDHGIAFLGAKITTFDFVHLATSAFRTLYVGYLDLINPAMLDLVRGRAAVVGHVDNYNEPIELFGRVSQSWLRTSFVFLPPLEIQLLRSLVSITDGQGLFSSDPREPFRTDAPLSENYRANIIGWLTRAGTGQGVQWHSRFDLTSATLGYFQMKALAIINEHALSIRLRERGCATVDVTWLANRTAELASEGGGLGAIPDWREQLAERQFRKG
jgi:hypothetical protein